jgi:predicted alternative tryptophan synthase beta-subunit
MEPGTSGLEQRTSGVEQCTILPSVAAERAKHSIDELERLPDVLVAAEGGGVSVRSGAP